MKHFLVGIKKKSFHNLSKHFKELLNIYKVFILEFFFKYPTDTFRLTKSLKWVKTLWVTLSVAKNNVSLQRIEEIALGSYAHTWYLYAFAPFFHNNIRFTLVRCCCF